MNWIIHPPLGINGIHFVTFPQDMGKLLSNLDLGELFSLVKKLSCFDYPIELHGLLVGSHHLCVHGMIHCSFLKEVMGEF